MALMLSQVRVLFCWDEGVLGQGLVRKRLWCCCACNLPWCGRRPVCARLGWSDQQASHLESHVSWLLPVFLPAY
jgi:hypothetical protein